MLLLLKEMVPLERSVPFLNIAQYDYFKQNEPSDTLKTMICRKYSFQKLTQFSQDAADSNRDGFLWRDTCVSSTL
jgi:hypothetical protein